MIQSPPSARARAAKLAAARTASAAAALLLAGCSSLPSIKLVEEPSRPFVQTDDLEAPRPAGDPSLRTRQLFLGVVAALRQQGRASAALAFLDDYDRSYPNDPRAQRLRADCLMDVGQQAAAEPIYRRLLDGPEEAAAQAGLGQAAAAGGRWAEAARAFGQAAKLEPSTVRYLNNQGYALLRANDAAQAEFVLRKAAQLDPGNLQTRNNLILCLEREGKPAPQQVAAVNAPPLPAAGASGATGAAGGFSPTPVIAAPAGPPAPAHLTVSRGE
jgi:tetratricopeptide (TPR) repeat protein